MADVVDASTRSRMMSRIRGKDTRPEIIVRKLLHKAGYRFRLHRKDLPGSPDVVLPKLKVAIFVHGCFWHAHTGCRFAKTPSTRTSFWQEKLRRNMERDEIARQALLVLGWRVLVVWECVTKSSDEVESLTQRFGTWLGKGSPTGDFGCTHEKQKPTPEEVGFLL